MDGGFISARKRLPQEAFNDDDIYIYYVPTGQLHRTISCNSVEGEEASLRGIRVKQGQTWERGLFAKYKGLWRLYSQAEGESQ